MDDLTFFRLAGIQIVVDDELGYQRAKKFTEELGLEWNASWFVYSGRVYVKPENSNVVRR